MNHIVLIGHVGKDPAEHTTKTGNPFAAFTLATDHSYRDKETGNKIEKTRWHNIIAFGKASEAVLNFIHKGDLVSVVGEILYSETNDENGRKIQRASIVAFKASRLAGKRKNEQNTESPDSGGGQPPDDIPF